MTQSPPSPESPSGVRRLYVLLLFAYTLLVLYGSLSGGQVSGNGLRDIHDLGLLSWPRYTPKTDIVANLLVYLPIGFLAFKLAALRFPLLIAALVALGFGSGLSILLEGLQSLMPGRVSSILDLILNVLSTLLGTTLGLATRRGTGVYDFINRFASERFGSGAINELGMTVLLLWLISQLFPFMPVLSLEQLAASVAPFAEALQSQQFTRVYMIPVYALDIIILGCVIQAVQYQHSRLFLLSLLIAIALGAKILIVRNQLSPEALLGAVLGIILVYLFDRRRLLLPVTGIIGLTMSVVIDKTSGLSGFSWQSGDFLWTPFSGYSNYMSAFSDILNGLWPYWALAYFIIAAGKGEARKVVVAGSLVVLLVASTLETLQLYQSQRSAELTDIITAISGWLLAWAFYLIRRHPQQLQDQEN